MGLGGRRGGDALYEVQDGLGRATLLGQHRLDDPSGLGLGEAALAQKGLAVLVIAGEDLRAGRLDRVHEGRGQGVGERPLRPANQPSAKPYARSASPRYRSLAVAPNSGMIHHVATA